MEPLAVDMLRPGTALSKLDEAPINDLTRLTALRDLGLAASGAQNAIDRLSRLASRLLDAPVSLVTLIDSERQIFLGQYGLDGELAERGTPISHSLCRHAVAGRRPFVVNDARTERLLRDNLAVEDLGVVAYAGVPLILEDGAAVGAFCAIDREPREWSREEVGILEDFASAAAEILNSRAALVHRSLHDPLTGLPNRELLVASCNDMLGSLAPDKKAAAICVGIDHFNMVNQAFGADKADRVLQAVAERLENAVRETDIFGRLRGDVFAVIAGDIKDEAEALGIASRVHGVLSESPLEIQGERLSIGATLGIAIGTAEANAPDLISEAANAMREAKGGHGRTRVAERDLAERAVAQLRMREALHLALEQGEIEALFQPIVELEGRQVVGYETLARWINPELGEVSPQEFVPLAELTTDILAIGDFIVRQAAAFAAALERVRGEGIRVTLNVSPLQLKQPDFAARVRTLFEREGLSGSYLGIELTEGVLLESGESEQGNLEQLREFGARILLDDFGTGYSSLGYLRDFKMDTIKIDRSFISKMADDRHSAALIQAILAMARGIDMEIVAEGVETEEQAKLLRLLGCRYGQGFGLGRPADAATTISALAVEGSS